MNQAQKNILYCGSAALVIALLYPPFCRYAVHGAVINLGYSWLFSAPEERASVNVAMLSLELFVICAITGMLWLTQKN